MQASKGGAAHCQVFSRALYSTDMPQLFVVVVQMTGSRRGEGLSTNRSSSARLHASPDVAEMRVGRGICVKHHTPPSSYHVVPRPVSCVPIRSLLPTNSLRVPHDRERRKQLGRDVRIGLVHGEGVARGRCIGRLEGCAEVVLRGEVAGGGGCALEK